MDGLLPAGDIAVPLLDRLRAGLDLGFARLVEHDPPGLEAFGRKLAHDIGAADVEKGAVRGIEPLAHQAGERGTIALGRDHVGEAQPLGGRGRGVADREDALAALRREYTPLSVRPTTLRVFRVG